MTEEKPKQYIQYSMLGPMIDRLQARVKHIPPDQVAALETIEIQLEIINSYAYWCNQLKVELQTLDKLNKSQAEMIKNLTKIQVQ
jgi:hypothetical protein